MAALSIATAWYLIFMGRLVVIALRTGRLQSRGRVYDRSVQPARHWLLTIAFAAFGILMVFLTFTYTLAFVRDFGRP
jgi:hypothetical protein